MGAGFTVDAPSNTKKADYGYSYDNKNSEYRATILPLVALGKLPETSWNNMYYHWVQKEGLPMADGYFMNAFVELTGNIFMNEMQLAPNTFAISHRNYVTATRMIAERLGYQIYGWAPATNPPTGYTEYGLDLNTVVSPYAAALLTTTEENQSVANFKKVVGLSLNGSAPLPDVLSSASGLVLANRSLSLDQNLTFLAANKNSVREIVAKTRWYDGVKTRIRQFNENIRLQWI